MVDIALPTKSNSQPPIGGILKWQVSSGELEILFECLVGSILGDLQVKLGRSGDLL